MHMARQEGGKYQLSTAIDGVTLHERVKDAVMKCRTRLDVNQQIDASSENCIRKLTKDYGSKGLNPKNGTAWGEAIRDMFEFSS